MANTAELESQILQLPAADRARLLFKAWESLADDLAVAADPQVDSAGLRLAVERDTSIESGKVSPIDEAEFRRLTGGDE
ncbi:MAG: addiction module protein [Gammaproteobacteria bacterium]|nr:addiction module protein [Gammaproteobacteria bacterium]